MKKNVIIIFILLMILSFIVSYGIFNYRKNKLIEYNNKIKYEQFYNKEILGTDLLSIMNKVIDSNDKNLVDRDKKNNYINNNNNSIKLDIKFKEIDKTISIEKIESLGMNQFLKNFRDFKFKCIKIEYHNETQNIKYLLFEEI